MILKIDSEMKVIQSWAYPANNYTVGSFVLRLFNDAYQLHRLYSKTGNERMIMNDELR
jgi:hypothetical protein